ncbi:hypothetical protein [Micromonospora sp. NPDC050276]|uniref:hypothetical protein n=1 Tax=Micromonospora sp. NPDC050276 TaxID=3364278 RepID=UPI0037B16628
MSKYLLIMRGIDETNAAMMANTVVRQPPRALGPAPQGGRAELTPSARPTRPDHQNRKLDDHRERGVPRRSAL